MRRKELFSKLQAVGRMTLPVCLFAFLPSGMLAQDDDMYFVPTKENVAKATKNYGMPEHTYYSGSNRSVDEYNRRLDSYAYPIDSTGNDIIDFSAVRGVYPDSAYAQPSDGDDYTLTRRMTRFDGYTPSEAYWDGYRAGRWASPWYSWYDYDPWYWDSWYWHDPFYYSSWYGWGYPYRYSGWYSPYYYGYYRPVVYYGGGGRYRGVSGRSWSRAGITHHKSSSAQRGTNLGGYRSTTSGSRTYTPTRTTTTNSGNLGGYRSSSSSSGSFGGGGGVSRSSGGFSGGGGGGRSTGGGRSYGGRR